MGCWGSTLDALRRSPSDRPTTPLLVRLATHLCERLLKAIALVCSDTIVRRASKLTKEKHTPKFNTPLIVLNIRVALPVELQSVRTSSDKETSATLSVPVNAAAPLMTSVKKL